MKKFKHFIEERGAETGGWRGGVDRRPNTLRTPGRGASSNRHTPPGGAVIDNGYRIGWGRTVSHGPNRPASSGFDGLNFGRCG